MKCTITIDMGNAAFFNDDRGEEPSGANGSEIARILRELADKVDGVNCDKGDTVAAIDYNGNRVGELKVKR